MALLALASALGATAMSAIDIAARRYTLAESASAFLTEADNKYVNETITIEPRATALVMVDVWDDTSSAYLSDNEGKRLLPMLAAARALGMLIVHAPSEAPEWPAIKVLAGEILVTGTDGRPGSPSRCDAPILNSSRQIKHVLVVGYDTNKCIIDKPCGAVALSSELAGIAELLIVRDTTRGEFGWFGNAWYGQHATLNMIELGWWLRPARRQGIASLTLADLLVAAGASTNASALQPLSYPAPSAALTPRDAFPAPTVLDGGAALVVVSCSSDYLNAGFRSRVLENRARYLEPLLSSWRLHATSSPIIHSLNGHVADGACAPRRGELVATSDADFDQLLEAHAIKTLYYVGYGANTDMQFGVGGMQRYYSNSRYLRLSTPRYFWVEEATIAVENAETLVDSWAKKAAMAYRQPILRSSHGDAWNVVTHVSLLRATCAASPKGGAMRYSLAGMRTMRSAADAITQDDVAGECGPPLADLTAVSIQIDAAPSLLGAGANDRKLLCFVKSVGTPFAVYQIKMDASGALLYQIASASRWVGTLRVPGFFVAANRTVRVAVVHDERAVSIFRNGTLVANQTDFGALDYSYASALLVGKRLDTEAWDGELGNVDDGGIQAHTPAGSKPTHLRDPSPHTCGIQAHTPAGSEPTHLRDPSPHTCGIRAHTPAGSQPTHLRDPSPHSTIVKWTTAGSKPTHPNPLERAPHPPGGCSAVSKVDAGSPSHARSG